MNMKSNGDITVRKMKKEDLDRILTIAGSAWGGYMLDGLLEDRHGALWQKNALERMADSVRKICRTDGDKVIVAELGGKVVGYATLGIYPQERIGEVRGNAVDTEYQGRGIGTTMNKWIIAHFRELKLKVARVCTLVHDKPARRMYEKQGFSELSRIIHYSMELSAVPNQAVEEPE